MTWSHSLQYVFSMSRFSLTGGPSLTFDEAKILPNFWFWHFCPDNCNILLAFDAPLCAIQEAWSSVRSTSIRDYLHQPFGAKSFQPKYSLFFLQRNFVFVASNLSNNFINNSIFQRILSNAVFDEKVSDFHSWHQEKLRWSLMHALGVPVMDENGTVSQTHYGNFRASFSLPSLAFSVSIISWMESPKEFPIIKVGKILVERLIFGQSWPSLDYNRSSGHHQFIELITWYDNRTMNS